MRTRLLLFLMLVVTSCTTHVVWEEVPSDHEVYKAYAFDIKGLPAGNDWALYFSQMPNYFEFSSQDGLEVIHLQGPLYKICPADAYEGKRNARVICHCDEIRRYPLAPQGAYLISGGRTRTVGLDVHLDLKDDGPALYAENANYVPAEVGRFDVIPQVKSLALCDGDIDISGGFCVEDGEGVPAAAWLAEELERIGMLNPEGRPVIFEEQPEGRAGAYSLSLTPERTEVGYRDEEGAFSAVATLVSILENGSDESISGFRIEDYPDMGYRGAMIDVARNFTCKEDLLSLIDELSRFKVNRIHLHFCDDEGWRIEIAELPELTEVGAFHQGDNEPDALLPSYNGVAEGFSSADGYYTEDEFVEILRHAAARGVSIIPEIESPGHARAAIVAMKKRGDLRLDDPDDASVYYSAQAYTDNVMNVASENTYRFMEIVISALDRMYEKAGVPFTDLHIGGDEVADGSWEGSPAVAEFMAKEGLATIRDLKTYFVLRMADICKAHGLRMSGWQEMPLHIDRKLDGRLQEVFGHANCWNTVPEWGDDEIPYHLANLGYGVVLSNVCNAYCDLAYNLNRDELGLNWGGTVNLEKSFALRPYDSYRSARYDVANNRTDYTGEGKEPLLRPDMIKGVQTQLFAETVREFDDITYMMFPKGLGVYERGWNAHPDFDEDEFYENFSRFSSTVYKNCMPRWNSLGYRYHIGQPGLKVEDGLLHANAQHPELVIRYTLDGSDPTEKSPVWNGPVEVGDAEVVKARTFYLDAESLISQLTL